ncbi:hypothetical protein LJC35_01525 [Parabacteroides sp. OttesenSCG-928-N08]|nr:hypothetical protein [Parabacteroides sp. OttesenSCG-928-N08]
MKINLSFCLLSLSLLLFVSCNKDEGLGGSSSLEGYVYNVIHKDDNFSFSRDTFPAVKEDVFIVFGNDDYYGDDVETNGNGMYRFDYLRKGTYTVYAFSKYADGSYEAVSEIVPVESGSNKAKDIYIHTGKAYGTAMIKGYVHAKYVDKGMQVASGPAVEKRVFINHYGEDTHFDDVRVGDQGYFIFQKVMPGKYEIWVTTEDAFTEKLTVIKQYIEIDQWGKVYELSERFEVVVTV